MKNRWAPLVIAIAAGTVMAAWYFLSGQGSLDIGMRKVSQNKEVGAVTGSGERDLVVTCKNGEIFKIAFTDSVTNYDELVWNVCGESGAQ